LHTKLVNGSNKKKRKKKKNKREGAMVLPRGVTQTDLRNRTEHGKKMMQWKGTLPQKLGTKW